jgi:hypothetical protein
LLSSAKPLRLNSQIWTNGGIRHVPSNSSLLFTIRLLSSSLGAVDVCFNYQYLKNTLELWKPDGVVGQSSITSPWGTGVSCRLLASFLLRVRLLTDLIFSGEEYVLLMVKNIGVASSGLLSAVDLLISSLLPSHLSITAVDNSLPSHLSVDDSWR